MSMHIVGYETSASEAALTQIVPIPDGTVVIGGANDIRVPVGMNNICFAAGMINSATATLRQQIRTPSLLGKWPYDIAPLANGLVFGSLPPCLRQWQTPTKLVENESMQVYVQNGAAVMNRLFAIFCDGATKSVSGQVLTMRATGAAATATASWVNSSLTLSSVLPSGTFQHVGTRAWSANGCAYRMFYVGGIWRPGGLMGNAESNLEWPDFRWGNIGVWGQFTNINPPSMDFMGITDTAQTVYLDLIQTA